MRDLNVETLVAGGTTQGTATAIPAGWSPCYLSSAGDSLNGIRLPPASKGRVFYIKNTGPLGGLGGLNVYPATGDFINSLAINTAISMLARTSAMFICTNSTTWETVPNVPS